MARIPYVDPATAPEAVREVFEQIPASLNIFKIMAHAETNFRPLLRLATSILTQQKLDHALREIAILRVAKLSNADYEWIQHVPIAVAVGVGDAQIQALEAGQTEADCFDERERLVLRFTTEVVHQVGASEATFSDMTKRFSHREIVELILAIGFYMTMARLMESTGIDVDEAAGVKLFESIRRG